LENSFITKDTHSSFLYALSITGGYQVKGDLISFEGTLNQSVNSTPITIQNSTKEQLVDKILAKAFQIN
jgi:hypothetical protein